MCERATDPTSNAHHGGPARAVRIAMATFLLLAGCAEDEDDDGAMATTSSAGTATGVGTTAHDSTGSSGADTTGTATRADSSGGSGSRDESTAETGDRCFHPTCEGSRAPELCEPDLDPAVDCSAQAFQTCCDAYDQFWSCECGSFECVWSRFCPP